MPTLTDRAFENGFKQSIVVSMSLRRKKLRTPEQLPKIGEDNFNLIWDFEADEDYAR